MQFSCDRAQLAESVDLVSAAAASKSTKKIFECLRMKADDEGLELTATVLEVAVRRRLPDVKVDEPGVEVVSAALFAVTLRSTPDETVSVRSAKRKVTLETDGGQFEFEGEDPGDFPEIPCFPPEPTVKIPAEELRTLVRKTSFATAREATRFALNGVRILAGSGKVTFVATDGRRLAVATLPAPDGAVGEEEGVRSAIVAVKGVNQFEKAAAQIEAPVDLALGERFVA
ncbi:MAG: hypothetical protein ACE5JG_02355, partial [Planctomycetota bacterium]